MLYEITVKELSQLRSLKREIQRERERLHELRSSATYGRRRGAGPMGASGQTSDRTGVMASEIVYLTDLIAENMQRCICLLLRLQRFINSIDDSEMRLVFFERYIKGRSWTSVAFMLGFADEQVARRRHDRFLTRYNAQIAEQRKASATRQPMCTPSRDLPENRL